jgi:geranylgeranyl diphosphate synthase type II
MCIRDSSSEDAELLYQFGIETGLAFQLKDDLLDVYGDTATFGKNIGGDILCNKKTFLLLQALKQADPATSVELHRWLEKTEFIPEEKIRAVTDIYDKLGIKERCLNEIEKHQNLAFGFLSKLSVPASRKEPLTELANELMDRKN